jgi:leucine efflux protein
LIGFQSLQKGKKKMGDAQPSAEHPFYRAFFISLLNPKAIFFFMSFFIQFVDANYPHPWLSFLVLGIVLQMISMLYLSGLILFGRKLTKANQKNPWLKVGLMWAVGLLFSGFSVRLVLEDLHS